VISDEARNVPLSTSNPKSCKNWLTEIGAKRLQPNRDNRRTEKLVFATSSRRWRPAKNVEIGCRKTKPS